MGIQEIIDALGGREAVAAYLGLKEGSPKMWRTRIPSWHFDQLVALARIEGRPDITLDVLNKATRPGFDRQKPVIPKPRGRPPNKSREPADQHAD